MDVGIQVCAQTQSRSPVLLTIGHGNFARNPSMPWTVPEFDCVMVVSGIAIGFPQTALLILAGQAIFRLSRAKKG